MSASAEAHTGQRIGELHLCFGHCGRGARQHGIQTQLYHGCRPTSQMRSDAQRTMGHNVNDAHFLDSQGRLSTLSLIHTYLLRAALADDVSNLGMLSKTGSD